MIVGIDVGGTFTDAVLVEGNKIIDFRKTATTQDVKTGIDRVLGQLMRPEIAAIHLGTTHALNALLQKKGFAKVGLIRIAGHRPDFPTPGEIIDGGFECDGRPTTPFCKKQAKGAIDKLLASGAERIAVVGTFSSLYPEQELQVAALSPIPVTMSHQLGGIGILEREHVAVANAALQPFFEREFSSLRDLHFIQNNGSLMSCDEALQFPILTVSAGPANSFLGASYLAQCENGVIVDIGGTSTDIGLIEHGIPKRSYRIMNLAGFELSLPMPDLCSLAIGGGSLIQSQMVGPESIGSELFQKGVAFGGDVLTLTDAALVLGTIHIPEADPKRVPLTRDQARSIMKTTLDRIYSKIKPGLPVYFVGGGSLLFPELPNVLPMASIANAYGAALAKVSSTLDVMAPVFEQEKWKEEALRRASLKGAKHPKIVQCDISPLAYDSLKRARMVITAL